MKTIRVVIEGILIHLEPQKHKLFCENLYAIARELIATGCRRFQIDTDNKAACLLMDYLLECKGKCAGIAFVARQQTGWKQDVESALLVIGLSPPKITLPRCLFLDVHDIVELDGAISAKIHSWAASS